MRKKAAKIPFFAECEYLSIENWEKRNKNLYKAFYCVYNGAPFEGNEAGGVDNLLTLCGLRVSSS